MDLQVQVISQQPPGGRCRLYADYARALAQQLAAEADVVYSAVRDAHGDGFPSLKLNGAAVQPEDGAIVMPADIVAALRALGLPETAVADVMEALDAPLERMLQSAGQA